MAYFLVRNKTAEYVRWSSISAETKEALISKLQAFDPSIEVDKLDIEGPNDKEFSDLVAYDRNSHRRFTVRSVTHILLDMIGNDLHVRLSSKHVDPPAHHAIKSWAASNSYVRAEIVRAIIDDLRKSTATKGHGGWNHMGLLWQILGKDAIKVPDEDRGRFDRLREHWLKWGDENGFSKENAGEERVPDLYVGWRD